MLVSCVCCVGSGVCDGLVQRGPTGCVCLIVCDLDTSLLRRPWPNLGCCTKEIIIIITIIITFQLEKVKYLNNSNNNNNIVAHNANEINK